MRSSSLLRCAAAAALGVVGCGLEPGLPWGIIEPVLEARLAFPASRLDDAGRVRTVDDYRVAVERVTITMETLAFVAGDSQALSFDPATPPPGYTLCHGGHCHADDGRLVDYAEVAAALAGGGVAGATVVSLAVGEVEATRDTPTLVPLEPCLDNCSVGEPVEIASARLVVSQVVVEGRVFDARVGDAMRLEPEGRAFSVAAFDEATTLSLAVVIGEAFGPGRDAGLRVALGVGLDPAVFDGIPWAGDLETIQSVLAESVRESIVFDLDAVSRFDP